MKKGTSYEIPRRSGKVKDLGNIAAFLDFREPELLEIVLLIILLL